LSIILQLIRLCEQDAKSYAMGVSVIPALFQHYAYKEQDTMPLLIESDAVVLFQGNSITDATRDYTDGASLGSGYAAMIAAWFSALYPEKNVRFLNRGISGNRVCDLVERWQRDTLDIAPSWLSVMIGINDCWRRFDSNMPTTREEFETDYRAILNQAREKTAARLIILDPFLLPVQPEWRTWREDLDPKIEAVHRLAEEFQAVHILLDDMFKAACKKQPPEFWSWDGVHPTAAGHALIAQAWLRAVGAM